MTEPWQRPHRVKVRVVDDEKLPNTIDLKEEIRRGDMSTTKRAPSPAEPDWRERYLRLAADLDNTKRRLAQNYDRRAEQEKEQLISDFLEVADNLERALAHADTTSREALIEGMQAIQRQFQQVLLKHDVQPFEAEGQPFNPERHEAIGIHNQRGLPANTVAHVSQTGYTIGDKVLRPARVIVTGND
jgi:molecular chaperone GrpE